VLPLALSLSLSGWFGDTYLLAIIVIVLALVLSNIMVRLYTR
jgi:positive regulator of sigma E activity